ncbi:MAG TPA: hypothetical protein VFQ79_19965 [Bryobacteraceae bacterium]|nr:hypothetical protein [Bryobacteraceae bacterium]
MVTHGTRLIAWYTQLAGALIFTEPEVPSAGTSIELVANAAPHSPPGAQRNALHGVVVQNSGRGVGLLDHDKFGRIGSEENCSSVRGIRFTASVKPGKRELAHRQQIGTLEDLDYAFIYPIRIARPAAEEQRNLLKRGGLVQRPDLADAGYGGHVIHVKL